MSEQAYGGFPKSPRHVHEPEVAEPSDTPIYSALDCDYRAIFNQRRNVNAPDILNPKALSEMIDLVSSFDINTLDEDILDDYVKQVHRQDECTENGDIDSLFDLAAFAESDSDEESEVSLSYNNPTSCGSTVSIGSHVATSCSHVVPSFSPTPPSDNEEDTDILDSSALFRRRSDGSSSTFSRNSTATTPLPNSTSHTDVATTSDTTTQKITLSQINSYLLRDPRIKKKADDIINFTFPDGTSLLDVCQGKSKYSNPELMAASSAISAAPSGAPTDDFKLSDYLIKVMEECSKADETASSSQTTEGGSKPCEIYMEGDPTVVPMVLSSDIESNDDTEIPSPRDKDVSNPLGLSEARRDLTFVKEFPLSKDSNQTQASRQSLETSGDYQADSMNVTNNIDMKSQDTGFGKSLIQAPMYSDSSDSPESPPELTSEVGTTSETPVTNNSENSHLVSTPTPVTSNILGLGSSKKVFSGSSQILISGSDDMEPPESPPEAISDPTTTNEPTFNINSGQESPTTNNTPGLEMSKRVTCESSISLISESYNGLISPDSSPETVTNLKTTDESFPELPKLSVVKTTYVSSETNSSNSTCPTSVRSDITKMNPSKDTVFRDKPLDTSDSPTSPPELMTERSYHQTFGKEHPHSVNSNDRISNTVLPDANLCGEFSEMQDHIQLQVCISDNHITSTSDINDVVMSDVSDTVNSTQLDASTIDSSPFDESDLSFHDVENTTIGTPEEESHSFLNKLTVKELSSLKKLLVLNLSADPNSESVDNSEEILNNAKVVVEKMMGFDHSDTEKHVDKNPSNAQMNDLKEKNKDKDVPNKIIQEKICDSDNENKRKKVTTNEEKNKSLDKTVKAKTTSISPANKSSAKQELQKNKLRKASSHDDEMKKAMKESSKLSLSKKYKTHKLDIQPSRTKKSPIQEKITKIRKRSISSLSSDSDKSPINRRRMKSPIPRLGKERLSYRRRRSRSPIFRKSSSPLIHRRLARLGRRKSPIGRRRSRSPRKKPIVKCRSKSRSLSPLKSRVLDTVLLGRNPSPPPPIPPTVSTIPVVERFTGPVPQNNFTPVPQNSFTPVPQNSFTPVPQNNFTPGPQNSFTPVPPPFHNPQPAPYGPPPAGYYQEYPPMNQYFGPPLTYEQQQQQWLHITPQPFYAGPPMYPYHQPWHSHPF